MQATLSQSANPKGPYLSRPDDYVWVGGTEEIQL